MPRGLDWERDGRDWPHRDASHFERAAGLRWHVQLMSPPAAPPGAAPPGAAASTGFDRETAGLSGNANPSVDGNRPAATTTSENVAGTTMTATAAGDPASPVEPPAWPPVALLIHGTGASTHSWRGLMPLLAERFTVVAADLPGHGFTETPPDGAFSRQFTLPGMAAALAALLRTPLLASLLPGAPPVVDGGSTDPARGASVRPGPALVIGHSAGAAIAARMCLDGWVAPRAVVSLNGAFLPLGGVAGHLFSPVAKLAAVLPFVPQLFSWRASDREVLRQLVDGTGSVLDAEGVAYYARLAGNAGHVAGALAMMANWDLQPLADELPRLQPALALMVGSRDGTIPPEQARRVRARLPSSSLVTFDGLGHLAHEEQPARIADAVWRVAADAGLLAENRAG